MPIQCCGTVTRDISFPPTQKLSKRWDESIVLVNCVRTCETIAITLQVAYMPGLAY